MADTFHNQDPKFHQGKILEHESDGIQEFDNPMPFCGRLFFG